MGKTILVVDDERIIQKILKEVFETEGFDSIVCERGDDAVQYIGMVDVLITDFNMPGMNGDRLVALAKSQRPNMPAMIMSGAVEDVPKNHLANKLIAKPFKFAEITSWVKEVTAE